MQVSFESTVETLNDTDGEIVATFTSKVGYYVVPPRPPDVRATLRRALRSGERVQVTYEEGSFVVQDAVVV